MPLFSNAALISLYNSLAKLDVLSGKQNGFTLIFTAPSAILPINMLGGGSFNTWLFVLTIVLIIAFTFAKSFSVLTVKWTSILNLPDLELLTMVLLDKTPFGSMTTLWSAVKSKVLKI